MSISATMACLSIRASYDTKHRLPHTPHRTYKLKPNIENGVTQAKPAVNLVVSSENFEKVALLLRRSDVKKDTEKEEDATYLGYERWLPSARKVKKPRSMYNASSLAYLGDCIYEDTFLQMLVHDNVLTETEREVLRLGKNIGGAKTKTVRRSGAAVYNRASS